MRKRCKSSKVYSALSWSWSSGALHSNKDAIDFNEPGAHGVTLDKIYAEEEKMYKEVKFDMTYSSHLFSGDLCSKKYAQ
ncbi:hypothetical protein IFM89_002694 [Coptis chinensis]|uniref:DUF632 domain-containing protein n=1 Tax=Coptis chinensis TaxID=261450 RepID=A0A835IJ46_9MAGN|nr:hypothetical protein IFM89_002694 [Coptis chinensis]